MWFKQKLMFFGLGCAFVVAGQVTVTLVVSTAAAQGGAGEEDAVTRLLRRNQVPVGDEGAGSAVPTQTRRDVGETSAAAFGTVTVRELLVVDRTGAPRCRLSADRDGPLLELWSASGDTGVQLGVDADGPALAMYVSGDRLPLQMGVYEEGPALSMSDAEGAPRMAMGVGSPDRSDAPFVYLYGRGAGVALTADSDRAGVSLLDGGDVVRAGMAFSEGSGERGTALELFDSSGVLRAKLGVGPSEDVGVCLGLSDAAGRVRAAVAVNDFGPMIGLMDSDGSVRSEMHASEHGPQLTL